MTCSGCGHDNRAGRKFCVECGATLALACAACSAPYEAGEKFCGECGATLGTAALREPATAGQKSGTTGAPIARAAADAGARKVVTIVFADLVGSTALHERLDAESARRVMERYYEALRVAVDAHGGTVVKLLGDGVMAAFGLKRVAEDDALRAVRAAVAMQDAFRALVGVEAALGAAGLRVAVNTGEVVVSGARDDVIGDPVNVAARLQEQGANGDVVLGEATRRLVATRVTLAPLGSIRLKGRAEAVAAYRVVSLDPPAGATAAPFVGRDAELTRLEAVYDAAVTTPATRLVVLLGSPGLGKSRLIDELARRHMEDATILEAHCDAAGGATFAPLAQALRGLLGLDDGAVGEPVRAAVAAALPAGDESERARIAGGIDGLLTGAPTSPEETFFVVRRFLAGLASVKPLVLVIDDLHWAEPLLLDLVEHLVQWGSGVPLFVLIGARPELRELRSSLVTPGGLVADVVTLGGLDAGAAMRLAANVIGAADLPAAVAAKVLATSEGNPLFVGELVRMLVQEGALTKDGERWIVGAGLAALEMPPTIHALLAARIERLRPEERAVLERAAVVGRHFSRSAVAALMPHEAGDLDARLESLRRSELIERDTGWLLGEPVLRFHHVLIRDAAYRRLLKGTRAELHGCLADWIEARVGDAPEHDEMIGWHLEQAHQLLRELGPLDAAGIVLGERAARRLAAAGRRALARDDVSLAASLLGRALDRLARDAPERAELVLDWCEALLSAGDVGPAAAAIAELDRVAAGSDRLHAWHTCFAGQLTVLTAPEALHATADRVGAAAQYLAAQGDAAGEAKAHFVHAQALARLGKVGACEAALDLALAAARRAGDRRRANAVLAGAPLAALWGPSPVTRASGRCLDVVRVLRITQGAPAVEAVALSCQGVLEALRGRTEAARRMLASSRTMVEELGISHRLFETDVFAGRIDLLEGDAPAAERALRAGYEGLRDLGLGIDAARAAALLGRALLAQDRAAEAETLSYESELLAGDDLQAAIAWRGVRAEALARRGDHAAAITLAEAAVAIAAATDALLDHADARLALAAALRAAGRNTEADAEERRAVELWEAKGATLLAEHARGAVGKPRSSPRALTSVVAPTSAVQRRVTANAATADAEAFDAAFARGDMTAFRLVLGDAARIVDHPTKSTYGPDGAIASYQRLLRMKTPVLRHEPLATLGDLLGLFRCRITAAGSQGGRFDVGELDREEIVLIDPGLLIEIFAADHLGAAIARLYERYAEKLLEGPSRDRAAVAARAVAFMLTPGDTPDLMQLYAPTYEDVDHRSVGYGALSLDDSKTKLRESFRDLVDGLRYRVDDVLALDLNGFVRKTTASGAWREGGGSFERTVCTLSVFGPDGRVTRHETFEPDREAEALARFDVLTGAAVPQGGPQTPRARTRIRPNTVTRVSAEFEGIVAARDFAALATFFADDVECIDHANGAVYGADGLRTGSLRLMQSPDGRLRFIPLATLGESWGLMRREISASGSVGGHFDVGAYEIMDVTINGTDEHGRLHRFENFATERLRTAVARLYELYGESLPEGRERTRASGAARALAALDGPLDADRIAMSHAPFVECVDHRILGTWSAHGREEYLTHWRGQADIVAGSSLRDDDLLALDPAAIVRRQTFLGAGLASGGAFETAVITVVTFGADGVITRIEVFEAHQEAEALACFDALTAGAVPMKLPSQRRVRPNAAMECGERFAAAIASRDLDAFKRVLSDDFELVHHPTGATYGRRGMLATWRSLFGAKHFTRRQETLATLGNSLVLLRHALSVEGFPEEHLASVGLVEMEEVVVSEIDEQRRFRRMEIFDAGHLGAAFTSLYERYAELIPDGPARVRAAATARSVAIMTSIATTADIERIPLAFSPAIEVHDRRRMVGPGSGGFHQETQRARASSDLATEMAFRYDDLLRLEPNALLARATYSGRDRRRNGVFDLPIVILWIFGPDGLVVRWEGFDLDCEAEAMARFDELTAAPAPEARPVARRLSPNAASALAARFEAAFAAGDADAVAALWADDLEVIDHPNGASYGRDGHLASIRRLRRARNPQMSFEPLATLGALCLTRRRIASQGTAGGRFDVGEFTREEIVIFEVGTHGRIGHVEIFAVDRLGDAIARVYERHAEQLPEGALRARAAMTARAAAAMLTRSTEHRIEDTWSPDLQAIDHRTVGFGPASGPTLWSRWSAASDELMEDRTFRVEDVLALSLDGLLRLTTEIGKVRASGGAFENSTWALSAFGPDGRHTRFEVFDVGHEAEALACFDALAADAAPQPPVRRRVRPNAASRSFAALEAAFARRDLAAVDALLGDPLDTIEHPTATRYGREGQLESSRRMMRMPDLDFRIEPLATLGDAFCLARRIVTASGTAGGRFDVGEYEIESIVVNTVDEAGRLTSSEVFASNHLCQAIARLYALYAESLPDGPERTRAVGIASSHAVWDGPLDVDRVASVVAPSYVCVDHRSLGTWSTQGRDEWSQHFRGQGDLAAGFSRRDEDILAFTPDVNVMRHTYFGTNRASGGLFENVFLAVNVFAADGLYARLEVFEPDQEAEALARFDALTAGVEPKRPPHRRVRANAATTTVAAIGAAITRRDLDAAGALMSARHEELDHRTAANRDRERVVTSLRWFIRSRDPSFRNDPLATLGDVLMLSRRWVSASGTAGARLDVGPYESEAICLLEVEQPGRLLCREEVFAPDRLGEAVRRLYERHAERLPGGPARERAAAIVRLVNAVLGPISRDRIGEVLGQDLDFADHRRLGLPSSRGRGGYVQSLGALFEATDDLSNMLDDVLALGPDAFVFRLTNCGTDRNSGGAFERPLLFLAACGADGLAAHWEFFDVDREADALARFDALVGDAGDAAAPGPATSPFANAATRALECFVRASAERDWQALADLFAPSLRFDDRRPLLRMELPRENFLEQHRVLFDVPNGRWITTPIATRGERLVLARLLFQGDVEGGGGALEIDHLSVLEVGDDDRMNGVVLFEPADLDAAYDELDNRFAAGEAAGCARAWAAPRAAAAAWNARDFDAILAIFTPDYVHQDHRRLLWGAMLSDPALFIRSLQLMVEMAPDFRCRIDRVVRLAVHSALVEAVEMGTRDGGAFETRYLWVAEVDADGRIPRFDLYDLEQLDQARARFAELAAPAPSAEPFANAASATVAPVIAAMIAHDWPSFAELFAEDFRMSDRRRVVQLELDRDQYVMFTREIADGRTIRATSELLATRGERLALTRPVYEFSDADVGPSEIAFLILTEVDARGRIVAYVRWDVDELDAAYAELDARYEAGEGAMQPPFSGFSRAIARRDWDAVTAMCGPRFVEQDHRSLALLGTSRDPEAWAHNFRVLVDLAPDTVARFDHVRPCPRGSLWTLKWAGSRAGGRYEIPIVGVAELDVPGKIARIDFYDPEQIDQARARFAELVAPAPSADRFANAATRALRTFERRWRARDWNGVRATYHPAHRMDDRRRLMRLAVAGDDFFANDRMLFDDTASEWHGELLATHGERLALFRVRFTATVGDSGPMEVEALDLVEVDAAGLRTALVVFDPDDVEGAYAELDARWQAADEAEHPRVAAYQAAFDRGLANRDWDALATLYAPTVVARDHRLVGWDTLRGPAPFVGALRAMVDLAPDVRSRADHLRSSERGRLGEVVWVGTRDGGAFESPFIHVVELDASGKAERLDFYDSHHLEAAWARFETIRASAASDAVTAIVAPNAAALAIERFQAAFAIGFDVDDWDKMRALCAPGMLFEDRRRYALLSGDRELMIASARERARSGARPDARMVGMAGDRVFVGCSLWSGGPPDGRFEIEYLTVVEVDEAGLITAMIFFEVEDARAAQRDAWARWAAIDPVAAPWVALMGAAVDSFDAHDRRPTIFADDVVVEDHRRTGFGRLDGADAYLDSLEVLWDLAPDHRIEIGRFWFAVERHGVVATMRRYGTLADGGAFESDHLWLCLATDGCITRMEMFELEDFDRAMARLAELRPAALRIPPNAATRWIDQWSACGAARDWEGLERLYAQAATFDDRRRLLRMSGDRAMAITNARYLLESGRLRLERTLLATAGDRLALERWSWCGGKPGADFAVDQLAVTEVDENGLGIAFIGFDPDDRAAASAEVFERYAARGAEGAPPVALDVIRAWNAHDPERLRALLPADFYLNDRRRTGVGRLDGADAYVASLAALWELSRDLTLETLYTIAVGPHGRLYVCRWFGTNAEGGEFDAIYVCLGISNGDQPIGLEIFELDDFEAAQARFNDLGGRP